MVRIDFNRLRFLIIDDNTHMRRIVRTLLHGFGTREVYEAEDGAAGLEAFTHYMPYIVLTDWFMPIFDGLELALPRRSRRHGGRAHQAAARRYRRVPARPEHRPTGLYRKHFRPAAHSRRGLSLERGNQRGDAGRSASA